MSKHFNGRKMSHTPSQDVESNHCPICNLPMRMFLGRLRCTQMIKDQAGNQRRVIKHGSMLTIRKRLRKPAVYPEVV
jgi:hypothetical protein